LRKLHAEQIAVGIIVITATQQDKTEEEAKSLGVIDYLKKPLDIFEVERLTSQVLS
jgi:response regulator of citrate/malate metabolism